MRLHQQAEIGLIHADPVQSHLEIANHGMAVLLPREVDEGEMVCARSAAGAVIGARDDPQVQKIGAISPRQHCRIATAEPQIRAIPAEQRVTPGCGMDHVIARARIGQVAALACSQPVIATDKGVIAVMAAEE